jgi:hypothetical protein
VCFFFWRYEASIAIESGIVAHGLDRGSRIPPGSIAALRQTARPSFESRTTCIRSDTVTEGPGTTHNRRQNLNRKRKDLMHVLTFRWRIRPD